MAIWASRGARSVKVGVAGLLDRCPRVGVAGLLHWWSRVGVAGRLDRWSRVGVAGRLDRWSRGGVAGLLRPCPRVGTAGAGVRTSGRVRSSGRLGPRVGEWRVLCRGALGLEGRATVRYHPPVGGRNRDADAGERPRGEELSRSG